MFDDRFSCRTTTDSSASCFPFRQKTNYYIQQYPRFVVFKLLFVFLSLLFQYLLDCTIEQTIHRETGKDPFYFVHLHDKPFVPRSPKPQERATPGWPLAQIGHYSKKTGVLESFSEIWFPYRWLLNKRQETLGGRPSTEPQLLSFMLRTGSRSAHDSTRAPVPAPFSVSVTSTGVVRVRPKKTHDWTDGRTDRLTVCLTVCCSRPPCWIRLSCPSFLRAPTSNSLRPGPLESHRRQPASQPAHP